MISLEIVLYVVLGLSLFFPIYTYLFYPLIISVFPKKLFYADDNYLPNISVLIVSQNNFDFEKRKKELLDCNYPKNKISFFLIRDNASLNKYLKTAISEITVVTDDNAIFETNSISELIKYFCNDSIGFVCGQPRDYMLKDSSAKKEGLFWRYEQRVKIIESGFGGLSGANPAIYAFRTKLIDSIPNNPGAVDFYIPTKIKSKKYNVIMNQKAIAYGIGDNSFKTTFKHRIIEGSNYWRAFSIFWYMLLPRDGHFVYVSHRVIRWFIPFNLIAIYIINFILVFFSLYWLIPMLFQTLFYLSFAIYLLFYARKNKTIPGKIGRLFSMIIYLLIVNLTILIGLFRKKGELK